MEPHKDYFQCKHKFYHSGAFQKPYTKKVIYRLVYSCFHHLFYLFYKQGLCETVLSYLGNIFVDIKAKHSREKRGK